MYVLNVNLNILGKYLLSFQYQNEKEDGYQYHVYFIIQGKSVVSQALPIYLLGLCFIL